MYEHVIDAKGNGTFKTRCDLCGIFTGEQNYILSTRLDGPVGAHHYIHAIMCKKCYKKFADMIDLWKTKNKKKENGGK